MSPDSRGSAPPQASVQIEALLGSAVQRLGQIELVQISEGLALGLSPGAYPKPYPHVDANEDAGLIAQGPGGRLLAVCDGHNGFDAAHAALTAVRGWTPRLLADEDVDALGGLTGACIAAQLAVGKAVGELEEPRAASRTALTVVLVRSGHLWHATAGDSSALVAGAWRTRVLSTPTAFLGPGGPLPSVRHVKLRAGEVVATVTDGVSDYLGSAWGRRVRAATSEASAISACRAVLEQACARGAGDHLTVAISA